MLRARYELDRDFDAILPFIGEMDCELALIDKLLLDDKLFQLLQADLSKRYPLSTKTGRNSTPVEVVLRMLALKHLRHLSYEQTILKVSESLVLRQFCRLYFNPIPNKSTLVRWSNLIQVETLKQLNQRLTHLATQLKLTKGRKIRTDGTVVATNIHYPSDNSLLADGVRVLSRLLQRAKLVLGADSEVAPRLFRNRTRTARRLSRHIDSRSRTRTSAGRTQQQQAYRKLIHLTQASVKQTKDVQTILIKSNCSDAQKLSKALQVFLPRVEQVIDQTYRRIEGQEKVSTSEKIVSIFENHTAIICRGKIDVLVEFGHKVWLDEVDGGIVSDYRVLKGNPHDTQQWSQTVDQHIQQFGCPPIQASADRGVYSQFNENYAHAQGVKRVILPKSGYKSQQRHTQEKRRSFIRGRRWHNGIEGRISVLKRCFELKRCLYHGESGFERWVGWGVIS